MSGRTSRTFLPALRRIEPRLSVPLPLRTRILRELEYDLEELQARLVGRGIGVDEARRRALDALLPEDDALDALGSIHQPLYRKATRGVAERRLRVLERLALATATTSVLALEGALLLRADLLTRPSWFLWPVLALGGLLFATVATHAFQLWVEEVDRHPADGRTAILVLSGLTVLVGLGGTLVDLVALASALEAAPERAGSLVPEWLVRDAALLSASLLISLGGGLAWASFSWWHAYVSGAHRDVLGLDPEPSSPPWRQHE